jgi:hypothetical protein
MKIKKGSSDNLWLLRFVLYGLLAILALLLIVYVRWEQPSPTPPKRQTFLPSFPGAEGFGASTPGGRYGHIVFVTNLNDTTDAASSNYPGSLRWAVEHTWPEDPADPARTLLALKQFRFTPDDCLGDPTAAYILTLKEAPPNPEIGYKEKKFVKFVVHLPK